MRYLRAIDGHLFEAARARIGLDRPEDGFYIDGYVHRLNTLSGKKNAGQYRIADDLFSIEAHNFATDQHIRIYIELTEVCHKPLRREFLTRDFEALRKTISASASRTIDEYGVKFKYNPELTKAIRSDKLLLFIVQSAIHENASFEP